MPQDKQPQSEPDERADAAAEGSFGYLLVMVITALLLVVLLAMLLAIATPVIGAVLPVIGAALLALYALVL
jgi:hypothetical protein